MAALKVKRVDLERRRLDVAEAVTEPEGEIIWGTPKNHERRSVPFPAFLTDAMTVRTEGKHPHDLLFSSPKGDVLRNGNFRRRRFDAAVETLQAKHPELPKITPHSLRHTAASLAISAGATVLAVQRMLGHASAAQQLRLAIVIWIERKYHRQRPQDALGGLTPVEYEAKLTQAANLPA